MSRSPLKNLTFLDSFISTWFMFFYVYVKSIFRPNHYFLLKKWTGDWTVSVLTWRKMALTHACSLLTTTFITSASFYTVPWDGNTPWSLLTKKHWQLRHVRTCQMSLSINNFTVKVKSFFFQVEFFCWDWWVLSVYSCRLWVSMETRNLR